MTSDEDLVIPDEQWVAHVCVASGLAHLDRPFDYLVPADLVEQVSVGVRVRVRLAGRLCDAIVLAVDHDHIAGMQLANLEKVVSAQPVTTVEQLRLARAVADHYAGTLEDVLRWAIPTRHARTEAATPPEWPQPRPLGHDVPAPDSPRLTTTGRGAHDPVATGPHVTGSAEPRLVTTRDTTVSGMAAIERGAQFLTQVRAGESPRGFWRVTPVSGPADELALGSWTLGLCQAVSAAVVSGRTALCCAPTVEEVDELAETLESQLGPGTVARLHAEQSTAARWRNYLAVLRGQARIVVGTRSAVMAPLRDLGVICVWDEGSDVHDEKRAPYPDTRDVAALRAHTEHAALLLADHGCSVPVARWLESGWLALIQADHKTERRVCAPVRVPGDSDVALARDPLATSVRIPDLALQTIRAGLVQGPVLVQVARTGDLVRPSCDRCRTPIVCSSCGGPMHARRTTDGTELTCQWCGQKQTDWSCATCGATTIRSGLVGASTTAEQLGQAFPDTTVVDSSSDHVTTTIGTQPVLVVCTPGAEPRSESGYAAAVVLDATSALERPGLTSVEQTVDRWFHVVSLVQGAPEGGRVVLVGPTGNRAVQALIRNDPVGWARRELADRLEAGFPPATCAAIISGSDQAVQAAVEQLCAASSDATALTGTPAHVDVLGPVPIPNRHGDDEPRLQAIVRTPASEAASLATILAHLRAQHTMSRAEGTLRIRMDGTTEM